VRTEHCSESTSFFLRCRIQRRLRLRQQKGLAGRGVHNCVNLARFDGPTLRTPLDQAHDQPERIVVTCCHSQSELDVG
jgi:hypothetical protein